MTPRRLPHRQLSAQVRELQRRAGDGPDDVSRAARALPMLLAWITAGTTPDAETVVQDLIIGMDACLRGGKDLPQDPRHCSLEDLTRAFERGTDSALAFALGPPDESDAPPPTWAGVGDALEELRASHPPLPVPVDEGDWGEPDPRWL